MISLLLFLIATASTYTTWGCLTLATYFGQSPEICREQIRRSHLAALLFALITLASLILAIRSIPTL